MVWVKRVLEIGLAQIKGKYSRVCIFCYNIREIWTKTDWEFFVCVSISISSWKSWQSASSLLLSKTLALDLFSSQVYLCTVFSVAGEKVSCRQE